ncbi:MAG TPA: diguanylate cyclase [Steroidobacteraceae bacterium]|nr:diguanylate cyclase [Steroidobacteraceae bacterium]
MATKSEGEFKQRYLEALERLESAEARLAKLESVFRLTIGRLCLAARGRSALLDEELRKLGDRVRRQLEPTDIEASLESLSRAVAGLDQMVASPAAAVPASPAPAPAPPSATAPPAPAALSPPPASTHAAQSARSAPPAAQSAPPPADRDARVQTAIVAMLGRLSALPELRSALGELQERPSSELTGDELAEGFERLARLIGEQRANLQREKLEIEDLLRQIDTRLEEIASYLARDAADYRTAQESTEQLNLLVLDEVHELNSDVQSAVELTELRGRVRGRLEAINTHLQDFRAREEERLAAQIDRSGRLRIRIAELERESRHLQRSLQEEQRLAMMDALTGIPNRAAYDERIEHEFLRWRRQDAPVSILAWDIDRFKTVNDAYGHRAGDKVLRVIAQHLAQHVRGTDFVARYGGEEFVMILVGTSAQQAHVAADKIRESIARIGFHFRNRPVTVTASCGITMFQTDDTPDTVFDRADRALYRAKDNGRNCCMVL